jgi:hypothetical protein
MKHRILILILFTGVFSGICKAQNNTLSPKEKKAGWKLLFDGKTNQGWHRIHQDKFPEHGWVIKNGELCCIASDKGESTNGGDIATLEEFDNFELVWEWKMLTKGGNSGLKYFVKDTANNGNDKYALGLEYQLLDDENFEWMKTGQMKPGDFRTLGSLYEIYPAPVKHPKPLGEYNVSRIISKGSHVEHWLNGEKILEYERGSADFRKKVAESKFKVYNGFGEAPKGKIVLQDHGCNICFRNIKIKKL